MIEYNGYITGDAMNYYFKALRKSTSIVVLTSLAIVFPIILILGVFLRFHIIIPLYLLLMIILPLMAFVPQNEKDLKLDTPKHILFDKKTISFITDRSSKTYDYGDVKYVEEHEDFYVIVLRAKFIINIRLVCQKELISHGTIEQFEKLFESKIVKVKM